MRHRRGGASIGRGGSPLSFYSVFIVVLARLVILVQCTYTECWNYNLYRWRKTHSCLASCPVPRAVKANIRNYCCNKCGCATGRRLTAVNDEEADDKIGHYIVETEEGKEQEQEEEEEEEEEEHNRAPSLNVTLALSPYSSSTYGDMESGYPLLEQHGRRQLSSQCPQKDGNNLPKCYTFFACKRCGKDWETANNNCPYITLGLEENSCTSDEECKARDPDAKCFDKVDCLWCNDFPIPSGDCGVPIPEFTDNLGNSPFGGICRDASQCCSKITGPGASADATFADASTNSTFHFECISCPPNPVDPCAATSTRSACTTCLNSANDTCMDISYQACILDQCPQGTLSTQNNWCGVAHNDRRCGTSFEAASNQCGTRCGIDSNCPDYLLGERCFSDLDTTPCNGTDLLTNPYTGYRCPTGEYMTSLTMRVELQLEQLVSITCSQGSVIEMDVGSNNGAIFTTATFPDGLCVIELTVVPVAGTTEERVASMAFLGCNGSWTQDYGLRGDSKPLYGCPIGMQLGGFRASKGLSFVSYTGYDAMCTRITPPDVLPTTGYLGCFSDPDPGGRDLAILATLSGTFFESCRAQCLRSGFVYCGLRGGEKCYCGDRYGTLGRLPEEGCSSPCSGDSSFQTCGGPEALSVYVTNPLRPGLTNTGIAPAPGEGYMGCFLDLYDPDCPTPPLTTCVRDLLEQAMGGGATIESCKAACVQKGYGYFGLQYNGECYCSNLYGRNGHSASCQTDPYLCSSNQSQLCGSEYSNSVYRVVVPGATPPYLSDCPGDKYDIQATSYDGVMVPFDLPTASGSEEVMCFPPNGTYFQVGNSTIYCLATNETTREEGRCAWTVGIEAFMKDYLCSPGDYVTDIGLYTGPSANVQQLSAFLCSDGTYVDVRVGYVTDGIYETLYEEGGFCSASYGYWVDSYGDTIDSVAHLSFQSCSTGKDSPIYGDGQFDELTTLRCPTGTKLAGFRIPIGSRNFLCTNFEPLCHDTVPG